MTAELDKMFDGPADFSPDIKQAGIFTTREEAEFALAVLRAQGHNVEIVEVSDEETQ